MSKHLDERKIKRWEKNRRIVISRAGIVSGFQFFFFFNEVRQNCPSNCINNGCLTSDTQHRLQYQKMMRKKSINERMRSKNYIELDCFISSSPNRIGTHIAHCTHIVYVWPNTSVLFSEFDDG